MTQPYDHPHVIAGQGTIGLEVCRDHPVRPHGEQIIDQLPEVDVVVCPISGVAVQPGLPADCAGGGLISGVATAIKGLKPDTVVLGAEPSGANDAQLSKVGPRG